MHMSTNLVMIAIQVQWYCKWGVACVAHVNSIQVAVIKNKFVGL